MADRQRVDEIASEAERQPDVDQKPIVNLESGKRARVTDVFRDADGTLTGFQVKMLDGPAGGPDIYRPIRFGGRRSRKNRKSKKRGGYKSRKSRRRTFR
jgi:hypothetical protein